ncbi:MAG: peptide ABC transporter substrate-binding protein [Gemmatimonadales bacterium]
MRRTLLCLLLTAAPLTAQQNRSVPGTLVMGVGQEATKPYPVVGSSSTADADVADQMFLRLASLGASLRTTGDDALKPELARAWHRLDSLTIIFELDPRARWHDGKPVVASDVVYAWKLMSNPVVAFNGLATLEPIAAVEAVTPQRVRVRFRRAFPEQVYLAGFNLLPMPAHLLERVPAESISTSAWAREPIGNGPYRFVRRVPGEFTELQANPSFFLGKPGIARLIFRFVADGTARKNLLISGETDVLESVPLPAVGEVKAQPQIRLVTVASNILSYALFNSRNPADTAQPNPILGDVRVREALTLALDRKTMATSVFVPGVEVPDAAQSQLWGWITPGGLRAAPQNVARAKALLSAAGWRDSDGDGILDRNGQPLRLSVLLPNSPTRRPFGVQAQQMWRAVGVQADLEIVERPEYEPRRKSGKWDVDFAGVSQDPAPSSLVQSWSCATASTAGTSNVGHWCDPTFDRLLQAASTSRKPVAAWGAVIGRMSQWHPAIFIAAPVNLVAVQQRFTNVTIWPTKSWRSLWLWRVNPAMALPRDR